MTKRGWIWFFAVFWVVASAHARFFPLPSLPEGWENAKVIAVGQVKLTKDLDDGFGIYSLTATKAYRGIKVGETVTFESYYWTSGRFPSDQREQIFFIDKKPRKGQEEPWCLTFFDWNEANTKSVEIISQFSSWKRERQDTEIRKILAAPPGLLSSFAEWKSESRKFPEVLARYEEQFLHGKNAEAKLLAVSSLRNMEYDENIIHARLVAWIKDPEFELPGTAVRYMRNDRSEPDLWRSVLKRPGLPPQDRGEILGKLVSAEKGEMKLQARDQLFSMAADLKTPDTQRSNALYYLTHVYHGKLSEENLALLRKFRETNDESVMHYTNQLLKKHDGPKE